MNALSKKWAGIAALAVVPLGLTLVACSGGLSSGPAPDVQAQPASSETRQAGGNSRTQAPIRIKLGNTTPKDRPDWSSSYRIGQHELKKNETFNVVLDRDLQEIVIEGNEECDRQWDHHLAPIKCSERSEMRIVPYWDKAKGEYTKVALNSNIRGVNPKGELDLTGSGPKQWRVSSYVRGRIGYYLEGPRFSGWGALVEFTRDARTKELKIEYNPVCAGRSGYDVREERGMTCKGE